MRIIKHGDKFELGEKICPTCHCVFAYTREDVGSAYNREEGYDEYFVSCPECTRSIYLSSKEIEK